MSKIAVMTDSNSGITQIEAKEMGITVLPMPFIIDGKTYYEDISLTQEEFYEKLAQNADVSTSQPSVEDVLKYWDKALEDADELVYIPMSSGLSGSCSTAQMLSKDYNGRVQVVDNQRISVTQRHGAGRSWYECSSDQGASGAGKNAVQYLHYAGYIDLSEKGRPYHSCSGGTGNSTSLKAGSADPGREAGCLYHCPHQKAGCGKDDQCYGDGY